MAKSSRKSLHTEEDTDSDIMKSPDKKKSKKEVSFQDSDIDDEEHIEENEVVGISPPEMLKHIEGFMKYVESLGKSDSLFKTSFAKLVDEYFASTGEDRSFDIDVFVKTYRKYFTCANRRITIDTTLRCVKDYLLSNECITHFNGFPRPPPSLLNMYSKRNNISIPFGKISELKAKMMKDEAGRLDIEHELSELENKYLRELESFKEANRNVLSVGQIDFVDKKIKAIRKKLLGPVVRATPKTPKAVSRTSKKTPFDLFVATKKDKYTDLDEESRIKKLQKKFDKLDDDKKEIFEKLALM